MAVKTYKLNQKFLNELFEYDDEFGLLYWRKGRQIGQPVTYLKNGYICAKINDPEWGTKVGKRIKAHRIIWCMFNGDMQEDDQGVVDHIDGDILWNRIDNLRYISRSMNNKNMKKTRQNTSGVTGVSYNKAKSKWVASISSEGKTKSKYFKTKEEAIARRKEMETEYDFNERHGTEKSDNSERRLNYKKRKFNYNGKEYYIKISQEEDKFNVNLITKKSNKTLDIFDTYEEAEQKIKDFLSCLDMD